MWRKRMTHVVAVRGWMTPGRALKVHSGSAGNVHWAIEAWEELQVQVALRGSIQLSLCSGTVTSLNNHSHNVKRRPRESTRLGEGVIAKDPHKMGLWKRFQALLFQSPSTIAPSSSPAVTIQRLSLVKLVSSIRAGMVSIGLGIDKPVPENMEWLCIICVCLCVSLNIVHKSRCHLSRVHALSPFLGKTAAAFPRSLPVSSVDLFRVIICSARGDNLLISKKLKQSSDNHT